MQIISLGDNLPKMSKPVFYDKMIKLQKLNSSHELPKSVL